MVSTKKIATSITSAALLMESIDSNILNTAIPVMSADLQISPIDLKMALISYFLALAIFIPVSGFIGDKYGIKRIFITALFIFVISSLGCGFAHNLLELVIARSLQGIGGALMVPIGRLIVLRTFKQHEIITTMSRIAILGALGMILGPVLGGVITHYFSWHWIFWINIPIGLLMIFITYFFLPTFPTQVMHRLDKIGFLLFGGSLAGFTFGLAALTEQTVSFYLSFCVIFISIILFFLYLTHSKKQSHPIIKIALFRFRTFHIAVFGNLIARLGFGGMPFLIPLLLQIGLGYASDIAGLLLVPWALGVIAAKFFNLHVIKKFGYKKFLIGNTSCVAACMWTFMSVNNTTSYLTFCCLIFIYGFFISLQYGAMNSLAYAEVKKTDMGSATSIMSTIQQLAQSFGVAICAILICFISFFFSPKTLLSVQTLHFTFLATGIISFLSIFFFLRLKKEDGRSMLVEENPT